MQRWWRRNRHLVFWIGLVLLVLLVAAASTTVMQLLARLMGLAFNVASLAALMIIQVVFYFGFVMYYLGGVKTIRIMPGQAGEVTFDDYWGQPELLAVARQWVELLSRPAKLREMGGQPVTGVLLAGPPGSGKTYLAKALAGEAAVPFLGLDGSRLISMWMGVGSIRCSACMPAPAATPDAMAPVSSLSTSWTRSAPLAAGSPARPRWG
jgi:hypothetical protein